MDEKRFLKRLGLRVAKLRKRQGFSQDRLYLEGGFSRGTISKIENALVNPQILTLVRISRVIGVPLADFFIFDSDGLD